MISNITLAQSWIFGYILLGIILFAFIAIWPIWGVWLAASAIIALWTKNDDSRFLTAILILIIFGPIGRLLAPGTILGSLWAFDFLILFGLLLRIRRFWPIRIGSRRDGLQSVSSMPMYFVIFSLIGLFGSLFVFPLPIVAKGVLYTVRWLGYYLAIKGLEGQEGREGKEIKFNILLLVALMLAVLGFLQVWLMPAISQNLVYRFAFDPHVGRLFSTWFDPNYLGGFLVVALLVGLGEMGRMRRIGRLAIMVIIGEAILLTFSRSSFLALIIGLIVYFVFRSPKTILLLLTLFFSLTLAISPLRERVSGIWNPDITAQARISSWQRAFDIIKTSPVVGYGFNLYAEADQAVGHRYLSEKTAYRPSAAGSDSSFLTIWATAGIGGFIVYLLLFWQIWRRGSVASKSAAAALFVHSLFVNSLLLPPFMIVFWLIYIKTLNSK